MSPKQKYNTTEEMAPLFLFLASSLNVELVYIILKSITQFQYINMGQEVNFAKRTSVELISSPRGEDVTLQLRKIKIKDLSKWEQKTFEQKTSYDFT